MKKSNWFGCCTGLILVFYASTLFANRTANPSADPSFLKRFIEFTTEKKDLGKDRLLSPIVAPFYAPETGSWSSGRWPFLTRSMDPTNPELPRSYAKMFGIVATKDTLGMRVTSEMFFKNDTIRLIQTS